MYEKEQPWGARKVRGEGRGGSASWVNSDRTLSLALEYQMTSVAVFFPRAYSTSYDILPVSDFSCTLMWSRFLKMKVSGSLNLSSRHIVRRNCHQQYTACGRARAKDKSSYNTLCFMDARNALLEQYIYHYM